MYAELKKINQWLPFSCYTLFACQFIIIILPTVNRILEERIRIYVINRSSNEHIQGNNEFPNFFSELFIIENYDACL